MEDARMGPEVLWDPGFIQEQTTAVTFIREFLLFSGCGRDDTNITSADCIISFNFNVDTSSRDHGARRIYINSLVYLCKKVTVNLYYYRAYRI